ncbi:hypothetical protein AM588_10007141 [Phytophthora nicotianae]|uniref:Uncharacterized protein n=1 Tax=Phytophthora nicotianae TaxID=4792 RepID=A0A0W8DK32_PHYNI|nr:hypothetical protein AM588_10007141 [Phytophthora nicotianae]
MANTRKVLTIECHRVLAVCGNGMETAMNFVATHILPRSVEYATRDVIWEPIVELQNLLQGHYYGQPVYKYVYLRRVGEI